MDVLQIADGLKPIGSSGAPPGLPIYELRRPDRCIFYTPGLVAAVKTEWADAMENLVLGRRSAEVAAEVRDSSRVILQCAREAMCRYRELREGSFVPECLTLYLHNQCNLNCEYCVRQRNIGAKMLQPATVRNAVRIVARNCLEKQIPMTVVFHGWGEPAYDFSLLRSLLRTVESEATQTGVNLSRYIATNGVVSSQVAEYLAVHFDLIGLSCDGPPEIQNRQRPLMDGGASSHFVERTSAILKKRGCSFCVRTTITRATMKHQEEIARYILHQLNPDAIYFEPAYRMKEAFQPEDVLQYWEHFEKARSYAAVRRVLLSFSGSRLFEIHGPYCNVFRNVLNLTPQNDATACFVSGPQEAEYRIGKAGKHALSIYNKKIVSMKAELSRVPEECRNCFNHFHCAGLCPEMCVLNPRIHFENRNKMAFRCRLQLLSAAQRILELANENGKAVNFEQLVILNGMKKPDPSFAPLNKEVTDL